MEKKKIKQSKNEVIIQIELRQKNKKLEVFS